MKELSLPIKILLAALIIICLTELVVINKQHKKIENIKSGADDLQSSIQDLTSNVDDFENTDWRYVVPKVKDAADEVDSKFNDLQSEIEN